MAEGRILRLGISTWCLLDRPLGDALELLSTKVNKVEILSDASHDLLFENEVCHSHNLRYTVHAPVTDLNIASCRPLICEISLGILEEVCRVASGIDASCVVVHPGFSPWMELRERSLDRLLDSLERLAAMQEEHGIRIAVENMGNWEVCHFRDIALLRAIRELELGFCLDIGHAHLNGALEEFLRAGKPDHVHLHDNHGTNDDHLALGRGNVDLAGVLRSLPRHLSPVLEMPRLEACEESLSYLRDRLPLR